MDQDKKGEIQSGREKDENGDKKMVNITNIF